MSAHIFRYEFDSKVVMKEVEATLLLAIFGTESLHGETATQLAVFHHLDLDRRACIVDATDPIGQDFNSLFAGYLRREFGPDAFRVRRVEDIESPQPTAA